jgi:dipeptidyl aminopeptidase/acylaminoacyl peptidase
MITGTDRFAAACAGAPVANMTSAYSGIRNESGMARQFQYEKAQSRIGGNLWKKRDAFIANSPLFFADKIHTPLLIMHGDEDEAVPFQQGVELYMAMRRLGKTAYFLQYRGEMHWPRKAPNKIDYAIRMKQFFDYYLLHTPMPGWMEKGIPYKD